ncbi:MAG: cytochrome c peroxidase [Acidobacteriota bacterium]
MPTAPTGNTITAAKAALGKVLFWDEQLSSTRTVACGTCHIRAAAALIRARSAIPTRGTLARIPFWHGRRHSRFAWCSAGTSQRQLWRLPRLVCANK